MYETCAGVSKLCSSLWFLWGAMPEEAGCPLLYRGSIGGLGSPRGLWGGHPSLGADPRARLSGCICDDLWSEICCEPRGPPWADSWALEEAVPIGRQCGHQP